MSIGLGMFLSVLLMSIVYLYKGSLENIRWKRVFLISSVLFIILPAVIFLCGFLYNKYSVSITQPTKTYTQPQKNIISKITKYSGITLGSSLKDVRFLKGDPTNKKTTGELTTSWQYKDLNKLLIIEFMEDNIVRAVSCMGSNEFVCPKIAHIGIGSSYDDIIRTFGTPPNGHTDFDDGTRVIYYDKYNSTFFLKKGKVNQLGIILSDYDLVHAMHKIIIEKNPNDAVNYYNQGAAMHRLGKYNEAVIAYNKAIELNAKYSKAYAEKCRGLFEWGDYEKTIDACNKAIEIDPQHMDSHFYKILALNALGKAEDVIEVCNEALKINPRYVRGYNARGIALVHLGRHKEALDDFDKAIEIDSEFAPAYGNKGHILWQLKKTKEAINAYDQAIKLDPSDVTSYVSKGTIFAVLGKNEEALKAYDTAIKLDSKNSYLHYSKGCVLIEMHKYKAAIESIKKAITLEPTKENYKEILEFAIRLDTTKKP